MIISDGVMCLFEILKCESSTDGVKAFINLPIRMQRGVGILRTLVLKKVVFMFGLLLTKDGMICDTSKKVQLPYFDKSPLIRISDCILLLFRIFSILLINIIDEQVTESHLVPIAKQA